MSWRIDIITALLLLQQLLQHQEGSDAALIEAHFIYEIPELGQQERIFNIPYNASVAPEALFLCHHCIAPPGSVECSSFVSDCQTQKISSIFTLEHKGAVSPPGFYNTQIYLIEARKLMEPFHVPFSISRSGKSYDGSFDYHYKFPPSRQDAYKLAHHFCRQHDVVEPYRCADALTREVAIVLAKREPLYVLTHSFHYTVPPPTPSVHPLIQEESIAIIINSNDRFLHHTIKPLLLQLISEARWPADQILVGVGKSVNGSEAEAQVGEGRHAQMVRYSFLMRDMMDFNGLVAALEELQEEKEQGGSLLRDKEWLFLIHDTLQVGPSFRQGLLQQANRVLQLHPEADILPLMYPMSMNIALYRTSYLLANAEMIQSRLMVHDDVIDPAERKLRLGHDMEDFLLRPHETRPPSLTLCDEVSVLPPQGGPGMQGSQIPRARIICPSLNLTKYQSTYPHSGRYRNVEL